jgi:ATP/maltotriose-dependent transcriptional regulator MalT
MLERAVAAASAGADHELALHLEARWIMLAQLLPTEALRRLRAYADRIDPDSFGGRLLDASLAWYGSLTGRPASETAERCRRAFADGRLVRDLEDDDLILGGYVLALLRTDELALGERVVARTLSTARARGSAPAMASASYYSAYLAHLRGDLVPAEGHARAAVAAFRAAGGIGTLPQLTALLVDTLTDRGQLDAAAHELAAARMDDAIPDHWCFAPVLWSRGYLRLAQGRTREAVDDLLGFARRCHRDGLAPTSTRPWASHAAPLLAQLDHGTALELAERELDEARAWGTPRVVGQALRGLALITRGADEIELLRESVRTLDGSLARLEHARALIDLGAALRRANQRAQAREPLRHGLDLAYRCGADLLAARATQELRATGARPRKPVLTGIDALTASERRIAEMAADGLSNREIAETLFVNTKTVETHLAHVFQKLDIGSRKQLEPVIHRADTGTDKS